MICLRYISSITSLLPNHIPTPITYYDDKPYDGSYHFLYYFMLMTPPPPPPAHFLTLT